MKMELLIVNDGSGRINKGQTFRPAFSPWAKAFQRSRSF